MLSPQESSRYRLQRARPVIALSRYTLDHRRPIRYYCISRQEELKRIGIEGTVAIAAVKAELAEFKHSWNLTTESFSWDSSGGEDEADESQSSGEDTSGPEGSATSDPKSRRRTHSQAESPPQSSSDNGRDSVAEVLEEAQPAELLTQTYQFILRLSTDIISILRLTLQSQVFQRILSVILYYVALALILYMIILWLWGSTQGMLPWTLGIPLRHAARYLSPFGNTVLDRANSTWSTLRKTMTTTKGIFSSTAPLAAISLSQPEPIITDINDAMRDFLKICAIASNSIFSIGTSIFLIANSIHAASNAVRASEIPLQEDLGQAYDSLAGNLDTLYIEMQEFNVKIAATPKVSRFELKQTISQISQIKLDSIPESGLENLLSEFPWSLPFWFGCFASNLLPASYLGQHAVLVRVGACTIGGGLESLPALQSKSKAHKYNEQAINSTIREFTELVDAMSREFIGLEIHVDHALDAARDVRSSFNTATSLFQRSQRLTREHNAQAQHEYSKCEQWGVFKRWCSDKVRLDREWESFSLFHASRLQSIADIASLESQASSNLGSVKMFLHDGRRKILQVRTMLSEIKLHHYRARRAYATAYRLSSLSMGFMELLSPVLVELESMAVHLDDRKVSTAKDSKRAVEACKGSTKLGEDFTACILKGLWTQQRLEGGKKEERKETEPGWE